MSDMANCDHRRVPKLADDAIWEIWTDGFLTFAMLEDGASRQHPGVSIATFTETEVAHRAIPDPNPNQDRDGRRLEKALRDWKENGLACMRCIAFLKVATQSSERLQEIVKRAADAHPISGVQIQHSLRWTAPDAGVIGCRRSSSGSPRSTS